MFDSTVTYDELQQTLGTYSAAECHGLLTAFLCADPQQGIVQWLNELQNFVENSPDQALLISLAKLTLAQLQDIEFGFQLMIPDDTNFSLRATGFSEWCQGFIFGIGITSPKMTEEIQEFIYDLTEITRLDWENMTEEQEQQAALEELIEFVRMGTMLTQHCVLENIANQQSTRH